ncbi:MAG: hypothetical protein IJ388_00015 [Oscillospiraceae bacterium]|nr:hypothetical protein [Oscillospiraceae bacterium]
MFFKRKYEFRPDKNRSVLSKLYLTKQQRLKVLKWLLIAAALVFLSILQDVIMSRVSIFGTSTDLVAYAILLVCVILDPEVGCVFALVSSSVYQFSGSAPGPYVIALLTILGVIVAILRQSYLRYSFGSVYLSAAVAVMVYEIGLFFVGLFLEHTTMATFSHFLLTGVLGFMAIPVLYPVFTAIGKIGGETWKE